MALQRALTRSTGLAARALGIRGAHEGTTHVVIGGCSGSGVGSVLARSLARSGATVVVTSRSEEKATGFASELQELAGSNAAAGMQCDASDTSSVEAALKKARELSPSNAVDGVVNTCGSVLLKPAHTTSDSDFDATMDANVKTAFATVKAAAKQKKAAGSNGMSIALCSSTVALHGVPNHEAIAAAKGAVISLARSAACTYASSNLRFNAVAPGLTRSPITYKITESEQAANSSKQMHAIKRLGEPTDVSSALSFLLDPANSWITGIAIPIDGGLSSVYASSSS